MADNLESTFTKLLKNATDKENFAYFQITIQSGSVSGEGYMSNLKIIRVTGTDNEGNSKVLNFVAKIAPNNDKLREISPIRLTFKSEIYMYDVVMPTFRQLEEEKNISKPFTGFAKCFATLLEKNNEMIILENLKEKGYRLWNRYDPMNKDHVKLVCQEYGRFHALSFALRDQKPELYHKIATNCYNSSIKFWKLTDLASVVPLFYKRAAETLNPETEQEAIKQFAKFAETAINFSLEAITATGNDTIILHGDPWCNNILFRYGKNNQSRLPTDLCFVDFQISRLGNPMLDLTHFFLTSSSTEVMDNWKYFLQVYYVLALFLLTY